MHVETGLGCIVPPPRPTSPEREYDRRLCSCSLHKRVSCGGCALGEMRGEVEGWWCAQCLFLPHVHPRCSTGRFKPLTPAWWYNVHACRQHTVVVAECMQQVIGCSF